MKKAIPSLLMAGALAVSASLQAATIDDFTVNSDPLTINLPGSQSSTLGSSSDFSTNRTISGTKSGPFTADVAVFNGQLIINTGNATTADTTVAYSNASGFDFSAPETGGGSLFDTFAIALDTIDQGGVDITLTVNGVSASQSINTPGQVLFAHSLFGDVSSVTSFEMAVHNNAAVDATFSILESFGSQQTTSVPEPAAIWLIGAGLLGFVGFRAKKSS